MPCLQVCELNLTHILPHLSEEINMTVAGSMCLGISGSSGIGKSVLLKAIADMIPHEGNIFLDGIECREYPAPAWRKKVALLPAESQWWYEQVGQHFSAYDDYLFSYFGFNQDVMDWQISHLSSGEKQRLAMIRVLLNKPDVLLLDEPTANLDRENQHRLEMFINDYKLAQQIPVLWISHDMEQLNRTSQQILYLSEHGYEITSCEDLLS